MPLHINSTSSAENPLEATESRMREALGVRDRPTSTSAPQRKADQARQRHRFVQDGEVPVVLNSRKELNTGSDPGNRLAAAESALDAERIARGRAERSLQEAQTTIQNLQTRLAHTELAHSEALAAERAQREQAEKALHEAVTAREAAEQQLREMISASSTGMARMRGRPKKITAARSADRPPSARKTRELQPVKWWLPSYRAKANKR
jgi:chromosome segregation ATPase